ncbi:hypothetical protein [Eubacterium maltosivorans]|uniref:Vitamin B12 dependent methionine synthase n=1 Tax=Eubacterium maltosivorans TaxID=2041044 RepID=A0A4P9C5K5_EUBML|nr:hypothetical protein [Eubacterium maltosivorans]QCT70574.1 hypothetical protein CPZ25_004295 [Eubacterium maltosivorans]
MEKIVFNPMEIHYDIEGFARDKHLEPQSTVCQELLRWAGPAEKLVRPRAMIKWCPVKDLGRDRVQVGDTIFESHLLAEKLKGTERVFATVVTAGDELDALEGPSDEARDLLKYAALREARATVDHYLKTHFGFEHMGRLNPGSLPDWPIANNPALFEIIGDVTETIGVRLTGKNYMQPGYTVSELLFSGDEDYDNCSLCKKYDCVGRKVPFDQKAYDQIFG